MLVFPNAKINLGLHVVSKRSDGFHNIETVFYPVQWCDALEITEHDHDIDFELVISGLPVHGNPQDNLVSRAFTLLKEQFSIPPITVHLRKHIPMGAGLGGGSADAAFFINTVCDLYHPGFCPFLREQIASKLGSDCAFFIRNTPCYAEGRGNIFSDAVADLSAFWILIIYPGVNSNTKDAYDGLKPRLPVNDIRQILREYPVEAWQNILVNDFEETILPKYPEIARARQLIMDSGAVYTSMSGSGSAVYGLYRQQPAADWIPASYTFTMQSLHNLKTF